MEKGKHVDLSSFDRIYAVIIYDGTVYSTALNHQELLTEISKEIVSKKDREASGHLGDILRQWDEQEFDLDNEKDLEAAIGITDLLFRENRLSGFDVFERGGESYLVSHYMSALEDKECLKAASVYARENGYTLAAFETGKDAVEIA